MLTVGRAALEAHDRDAARAGIARFSLPIPLTAGQPAAFAC